MIRFMDTVYCHLMCCIDRNVATLLNIVQTYLHGVFGVEQVPVPCLKLTIINIVRRQNEQNQRLQTGTHILKLISFHGELEKTS